MYEFPGIAFEDPDINVRSNLIKVAEKMTFFCNFTMNFKHYAKQMSHIIVHFLLSWFNRLASLSTLNLFATN